MKTIILHGEDEAKSYDRLTKFIDTAKARSWEIIYLDESKLEIVETISGSSLFPTERFFVLRDFKKLTKKDLDWLNKGGKELKSNLVIYHSGVLPVTFLKGLTDSKVEEFKLPKLMFEFLDSFFPGNAKNSLTLLHELIITEPPEFILSLLGRHLRDLYWVKEEEKTLLYPSWRIGKLKEQAKDFDVSRIKEILEILTELDVKVKTTNTQIIPSLDLLIATKLE